MIAQHSPEAADQSQDRDRLIRFISVAMPKNENPAGLADRLLHQFGSYASVLSASSEELRSIHGVGQHMLSGLRVIREAALRLHRSRLMKDAVLENREKLYEYLTAVLAREVIEQFHVLYLSPSDHLITDEAQARGTVNHTPVYPREVVRRALELDAASVVLVHNHPSGDPSPSADDISMTRQVISAASVLGITVRDHIIIGNGRRLSFSEAGLL
ncbi:DNA repair protein RadC [Acetobacter sp. AN02]|uniref:RadC family protein n=1 Tax=Acetobacter sp. AN02 TaxID=2894186 RepID=UPI00243466ED|nr:DNA repair protein RadC [Acetobacter sp. AN02]MDG6093958.1 DNA repair protein RadC [Acetobacter sp. AN02]